jgi:hypothetical protein
MNEGKKFYNVGNRIGTEPKSKLAEEARLIPAVI